MLFNTISFYIIFITFLVGYALLRKRSRALMILYVCAFNLFFFWKANAELFLLMPFTAFFSWIATIRMDLAKGRERKLWLAFIIVVDLIPLIYYKYYNFGIVIINDLLKQNFPLMDLILPVGISFYTFQAISYSVDVYRGRFTEEVDFMEYLFFLSFFPLLLAGPITRAEHFFPQLREKQETDEHLIYSGLWLIMIGLIKKSVIADYISQYNNWIFDDPMTYSGFENLMGIIGYYVQIYCDFSGYSDMSIGLAALMGIELKENFRLPYQATSLTDFWHRWHISLSTWFRDYVYIPLGGNRVGSLRTYLNNFITLVLAGLWHGASMMFVIWGALHGVGIVINKFFKNLISDSINSSDSSLIHYSSFIFSWLLTQMFVAFAWVFFRSSDLTTCGELFSQVFTNFDIAYLPYFLKARPMWTVLVLVALIIHAIREEHYYVLQEYFVRTPWIVKLALFLIVIQLAIQFSTSNVQPFIYYQF